MSEPLQEQLLGYVVGALDDDERDDLEERLAEDHSLRRQLARARHSVRMLQPTRGSFAPPPGLAARACLRVARAGWRAGGRRPTAAAAAMPGAFRLPDLAATATVCVLAWMMLLPAVQVSRHGAQVSGCQENLRRMGFALEGYSQRHNDLFPSDAHTKSAGAVGLDPSLLVRDGYLTRADSLLCPASATSHRQSPWFRPALADLTSHPEGQPPRLDRTAAQAVAAAGGYGFHLGNLFQGKHYPPRNRHRSYFALIADAPGASTPSHQSPQHGGQGQNVLFENGCVRFLTCSRQVPGGDDFFINDEGFVAAGVHPNDAVIAPAVFSDVSGETTPAVIQLER